MNCNTQNAKIASITEKTLIIGIDVGSETHYARAFDWRNYEYSKKPLEFSNTEAGFLTFKAWIEEIAAKQGKTAVIPGMEPTGHYWFALGKFLQDNGMKPVHVNPHHVKKSKELDDNNPNKNDRKDPKTIAALVNEGRFSYPYEQCVVAHVKSSNAAIGDSFTYTIGERGGVAIGEYTQLTAYDLDTASARAKSGVRYEDEPVVTIVRKLMEENTAIKCIGYSALTEISERLYGKAPYSNGKGWKAAIKRVQRELVARDKIIVKDAKTVESEYVIFGEHKEKGNTQIRGISLSKTLPIDLDALLGKDDENE